MSAPPWKVGELARRTGLSVRTLHHYDEIDLLQPSVRTAAGHRLYDRLEVERLQQIQALRLMGLSLDEVKRLLDGATMPPRQVIALQLQTLRARIASQQRLAERLEAIAGYLTTAEHVSIDELCDLIEAMTTMEKYFTPEQLEVLRERRTSVGEARIREVEAEWAEIIPRVRRAIDRGEDPTSPEILAVARRWKTLVNEFTAGDPQIANAVRTMYEREGALLKEKVGKVPTPDMFPYMQRAFAALKD